MKRVLRHIIGFVVHVRYGWSWRTYNDGSCGCQWQSPRWLW